MSETENTPVPADDTEGHTPRKLVVADESKDDVEGHGVKWSVTDDQDDVEGHRAY